jgi:hypothetical protein
VATIEIERDTLVVSLSSSERLMAFHGDLHVPLAAVRKVAVESHPYQALRGIRAPGTGWPGVVAYGVRRLTGDRPDFAAVHGQGPAVRVWLGEPSPYAELIVTVDGAEECSGRIRAVAGL